MTKQEYIKQQEQAFKARLIKLGREYKLKSEPNRHRRPVKNVVISADEIDFKF